MGSKKSSPPPAPDPQIGQAALQQAQYGREYLDFAKQQYADGLVRQDASDALVKQVADASLASQAQADAWAQEDRVTAQKYNGWADEDRALGRQTMADLTRLGNEAADSAKRYEGLFGAEAARQNAFGVEETDRYKTLFRPVQDKIVNDAMTWDSDGRLESEAAKAKADVTAGAAQQQEAQRRSMASMGIDPRSGRYQGIDRSTSLATALAGAGAQNVARDGIRSQAIQLRGQAGQLGQQVLANGQQASSMATQNNAAAQTAARSGIDAKMSAANMGLAAAGVGNTSASLGLSGQSSGYSGLGLGLNAGQAATGANAAGVGAFNANAGIMGQGFGAAMNGAAGQASTLNSLYGSQLQGWSAQQQANASRASGLGGALGTVAGLGLKAYGMGIFG